MLFPLPQPSQPPPRIVVTGGGIVTALGAGWRANADGFRTGRTAFRPVALFDVSRQRTRLAGTADLPVMLPPTRLPPKSANRLDRASKLLLLAAYEAWSEAGWEPGEDLPLVLGTTSGEISLGEAYLRQTITAPHSFRRQPTRAVQYQVQRQGLDIGDAFGFRGPITIIANACASGANAIGHAWEMLRHGRAERAFAGGYEALSQLTFAGFDSLQVLSPTTCRPFDVCRDGLLLGEGAGMLTLETLAYAQRRNANILGEIIGYGTATDTHHLAQPHPEGDAALAAMIAACRRAGIGPEQVDYLNAHGTGTPQNDRTETSAINRWAGSRASTLPVSSTKASIGHLLGAAGAVEALACLMALRGQWLPPQITLTAPEPACRFQLVREPVDAKLDVVLSNSFGFGGANATLVVRRWQ